jgi:hypothetical protein
MHLWLSVAHAVSVNVIPLFRNFEIRDKCKTYGRNCVLILTVLLFI